MFNRKEILRVEKDSLERDKEILKLLDMQTQGMTLMAEGFTKLLASLQPKQKAKNTKKVIKKVTKNKKSKK